MGSCQARVLVSVENVDTDTIFNASGLDFDGLSPAIAYINANTLVQKEVVVRWDELFLP